MAVYVNTSGAPGRLNEVSEQTLELIWTIILCLPPHIVDLHYTEIISHSLYSKKLGLEVEWDLLLWKPVSLNLNGQLNIWLGSLSLMCGH